MLALFQYKYNIKEQLNMTNLIALLCYVPVDVYFFIPKLKILVLINKYIIVNVGINKYIILLELPFKYLIG